MSQAKAEKQETPKKHGLLVKAAVIGVVAGLLGGGIAYAGLSRMDNGQTAAPQATISQTSTAGSNSKSAGSNSGQMTPAFQKVKNAVVSVVNLKRERSNSDEDDLWSLFGGDGSSKGNSSGKLQTYSEGSGLIYTTSGGKGYIVTNNHVVSGSDQIRVILSSGKRVAAKLIGTDSVTDLAVLSIDSKYVTQTASFGSAKNLQPGDPVIAVGSPMGSQYATSVTQGIISAARRTITTSENGNQATVIQTDAAINPGNSGGPLVDQAGKVVGINSMKLSQSSDGTSVEGMGFAIPSDEVVVIINQLVKNGKITRPQLGIRVADINELTAYGRKKLSIPSSVRSGVYVATVSRGSSAANAGLRKGDIIVKADSKAVDDVATLHTILYSHKLGDTISLQIVRSGRRTNLSVTLRH